MVDRRKLYNHLIIADVTMGWRITIRSLRGAKRRTTTWIKPPSAVKAFGFSILALIRRPVRRGVFRCLVSDGVPDILGAPNISNIRVRVYFSFNVGGLL